MGWCSEFGCGIEPSCDHPMVAGRQSCSCDVCGVGCGGRFAGCREVWAAGPKVRPARTRGLRSIPVAATTVPAVQPRGQVEAPAARPVVFEDDRLRSMSETVDRMGRQLRGVVKLLNQQPAAPAPTDDTRIVVLGESVERMGRELRGVLNLLIQQQASLARLTDARQPIQPLPPAQSPQPAHTPQPDPLAPVRPTGIGGVQRRPQSSRRWVPRRNWQVRAGRSPFLGPQQFRAREQGSRALM